MKSLGNILKVIYWWTKIILHAFIGIFLYFLKVPKEALRESRFINVGEQGLHI